MLNDEQRKQVFRTIIITQCLGMICTVLFQNGFYLNYFTKLGFSSSSFALLASLPALIGAIVLLPFAFLSDRLGKIRLSLFGQILMVASFIFMMIAGWFSTRWAMAMVVISLLLFCVGGNLQGAGWFALLNPIVPPEIRGRFFGRLRVTFMTVNILFTLVVAALMKLTQALWIFQLLAGVIVIAQIIRYFTFAKIPELEREDQTAHQQRSFFTACAQVFRIPGFTEFNAYVFLITLFTAGVPIVFGLMQKDIFAFSEAQIMMVGNFFLAGSVAGCAVGGRAVDRIGTKLVFLITHLAYATIILSMLVRASMPWSLFAHVSVCSFIFSFIGAMAGVAITSEILALIPAANKSLSTGVSIMLFNLGIALSSLFVSGLVEAQMLAPSWQFGKWALTNYDTILLAFAGLIILMLAAIGLVPSVVKTARLMPGSGIPRV